MGKTNKFQLEENESNNKRPPREHIKNRKKDKRFNNLKQQFSGRSVDLDYIEEELDEFYDEV